MRDSELKKLVEDTRLRACRDLEETMKHIVSEINKQRITKETDFLQVHISGDCLARIMQMRHDLHTLWQTL